MKNNISIGLFAATLLSSSLSFASYTWDDDSGILFNQPSKKFNATYYGYGSSGQTVYNKIDLQDGRMMTIQGGRSLYDNQGNIIAETVEDTSVIGYYNGTRDGGLVPGSFAKIRLSNGKTQRMTYAWSVNVAGGGRASGWVRIKRLAPKRDINSILKQTQKDKQALWDEEHLHSNYQSYTVEDAALPSYMEEYYLDPGRDASYTAGKAKYYYTREGRITGLMNIPETGSQRYGVGHDVASAGTTFYRDMNIARIDVKIYPPSSYDESDHKLQLVWGFFETSAGSKVFSWVNKRALD